MRINSVSQQSFGARANTWTKLLLFQLESNGIDTKPHTDIINKIYVGDNLSTKINDDGSIYMDIFDKNGDQKTKAFDHDPESYVNPGTFKLKDPERFSTKLYAVLQVLASKRNTNQKISDKVNSQLHE